MQFLKKRSNLVFNTKLMEDPYASFVSFPTRFCSRTFQGGEGIDFGSLGSTHRVGLYPFWRGRDMANADVVFSVGWQWNHLIQQNPEVKKQGGVLFSLFQLRGNKDTIISTKKGWWHNLWLYFVKCYFWVVCLDCIVPCAMKFSTTKNCKVPIGSASIGQVHRATLAVSGLEVVVKVPSWDEGWRWRGCGPSQVAKMGLFRFLSVKIKIDVCTHTYTKYISRGKLSLCNS